MEHTSLNPLCHFMCAVIIVHTDTAHIKCTTHTFHKGTIKTTWMSWISSPCIKKQDFRFEEISLQQQQAEECSKYTSVKNGSLRYRGSCVKRNNIVALIGMYVCP